MSLKAFGFAAVRFGPIPGCNSWRQIRLKYFSMSLVAGIQPPGVNVTLLFKMSSTIRFRTLSAKFGINSQEVESSGTVLVSAL